MDCTILIKFALLATFGCQAAGKLIVRPRDTDVKVNHSTYFNCSTDHGLRAIFWYHGTKHVYTGNAILEPYHERFRVDRDERNGTYIYNLVIHSVQPGDAGQYKCAEDEGVGEEYSVQLTVLDDDPICRSNVELDEVIGQNTCKIEPDEVELECSVTYHGKIPPQMKWKKDGENSSTPFEVSVVTSRNHFVSTLKLKGDIALNNSSYVCETKRTTQEPIKCISQVIKILYAVSGNSTLNKTIETEIPCNANASQSCNYKWIWLQDNDFTIESTTAVLKARKPGLHRCEAECYLRNQTCNLLVMRARVSGYTAPTFNTILAGVAVLFGITSSTITIILCLRLRRRNSAFMAQKNSRRVEARDYDMIPYDIPDCYDTIGEVHDEDNIMIGYDTIGEDHIMNGYDVLPNSFHYENIKEVDEKDDTLLPNLPPRHGPLPTPGYAALMPDEPPKPPGVYSTMDHQEKSVEDEENNVRKDRQSDIDIFNTDDSKRIDVEKTTMKITSPISGCLVLEPEINIVKDIAAEGEEIPSAHIVTIWDYNNIVNQTYNNSNVQDTI